MPLLALFLAWLVPGAGHAYIGRVRRGIVIFAVISATFWAGVAVGGVMTVDSYSERWWFAADVLTGVHGLVGWRLQHRVLHRVEQRLRAEHPEVGPLRPPPPDTVTPQQILVDRELTREGIALVHPTDTVARAYAGVAGLLNLMCIFDAFMLAVMGVSGEPPPQRAGPPPAPAPVAGEKPERRTE